MVQKLKKVKATTNNITKGIVAFLRNRGHSASRVNTTGIWDARLQRFRKTGARKGFYDIACTIKSRYWMDTGRTAHQIGITLMVDTKRGKDELSDDQIEFKAEIENAGGITFESKNYNDFVEFYNTYLTENYL